MVSACIAWCLPADAALRTLTSGLDRLTSLDVKAGQPQRHNDPNPPYLLAGCAASSAATRWPTGQGEARTLRCVALLTAAHFVTILASVMLSNFMCCTQAHATEQLKEIHGPAASDGGPKAPCCDATPTLPRGPDADSAASALVNVTAECALLLASLGPYMRGIRDHSCVDCNRARGEA